MSSTQKLRVRFSINSPLCPLFSELLCQSELNTFQISRALSTLHRASETVHAQEPTGVSMHHSLHSILKLFFCFSIIHFIIAQPPRFNGRDSFSLAPHSLGYSALPGSEDVCRFLPFRTLTGRCTSTTVTTWGESRLPQFSYVRRSSSETPSGRTRKSAREISNIVATQVTDTVNARGLNLLFVFFGQFLDHNLIATPEGEEEFDIPVPESDPDLSLSKLPFKRSMRGQVSGTSSERAINTLTSAIDLDAVYGPSEVRNSELLELDSAGSPTGKLKTSGDNLLPRNVNGFFNAPDSTSRFFLAGDHRSNEHPVLTVMHTIFLREHNRLVDEVVARLPSLNRTEVYEFARKINIAQFQKIVYEQFYPAFIGRRLPPYQGFRRTTDPTVSDIFGGAAFRFGHTLVSNDIPRMGPSGPLSPVPMAEVFFRVASTFSSVELENIVRGTANTVAQEVDAKVVDALRNQLFDNVPEEEGFDLVALNLQRGRDYALPTLNQARLIFGLPKLNSFEALTSDPETASNLATAYNDNIDEVELFLGLIAEDHLPGSSAGLTMAAIWRKEFKRLRDGDQFFYLRTEVLPTLLRETFPDIVATLTAKGEGMFQDIIVRNAGIAREDLPQENIFMA